MGFLPIALGIGSLAGKLFGGLAKHKQEQKQAEAMKAEQERYRREATAANDVDENRRVERLNAVQGLLQRTGQHLRAGAPDYTFDPAVLGRLQEKRPFVSPLGTMTDPKAGLGWGAVAGAAQGTGGLADNLLAEYYKQQTQNKVGTGLDQIPVNNYRKYDFSKVS